MFSVVKLVSDHDVPWDVGVGDPAWGGELVEPHDYECHDFDNHAGGEDTERQATTYVMDSVFDCVHGLLGISYMFILC